MKIIVTATLGLLLFAAVPAAAEDLSSSIVGVWRLASFERTEVMSGKSARTMGEHPTGYAFFAKGGHVVSTGFAEGRKPFAGSVPTDAERAELFKTMYAYGGSYDVQGDAVTITVDTSWNVGWIGTKVVRKMTVTGNKLEIETAPIKSASDGLEIFTKTSFERVE
jgi:hypothetical protein